MVPSELFFAFLLFVYIFFKFSEMKDSVFISESYYSTEKYLVLVHAQ